ncbi:MAG: PHP domain-containing protein [Alphaproteobacteria bacterium]|nr:PHP domain-containing protein [Alphaproteobacteria bacterium]
MRVLLPVLLLPACAGLPGPEGGPVDTDPTPVVGLPPGDGGNGGTVGPSPCAAQASGHLTVDAPSDGGVVRGASTPVVVRITPAEAGSEVSVCLDGEPVPHAWPEVRRRSAHVGGDWDVVAGLDLLGHTEPGPRRLDVVVRTPGGRVLRGTSEFTWDPRPHRLDVQTVDGAGRPVSARVHVLRDGKPVALGPDDGEAADPYLRDVPMTSFFSLDGHGATVLSPGTYRLVAVRSIRDDLGVAEVTVPVDGPVRLVLPEVVPTPGRLTADLHVHTAASYDAFLPHDVRLASLVAAGVDVAVITDHNRVTSLDDRLVELLGPARGGTRLVPGIEVDVRERGELDGGNWDLAHLNVFPVADAAAAPFPGLQPETFGGYYDDLRARQHAAPLPGTGTDVLLQLNHPRGIHFQPEEPPKRGAWPLFQRMGFDPSIPVGQGPNAWAAAPAPGTGTTPLDVDALEVVNRFSLELYQEVRRDWFALLSQGYRMTGTGNADSHALQVEIAGFPVNLVRAAAPVGAADLDRASFLRGLRGGDVLVSTGPVVELEVRGDGDQRAGPGGAVRGASVTAEITVRAAPWVPVAEVRLVVDGEVVHREALDAQAGPGAARWTLEVPVTLAADAWVLAEAGVPPDDPGGADAVKRPAGDYAVVAPGYVPLAFTNPVRVDADGDGAWTPPGLFP